MATFQSDEFPPGVDDSPESCPELSDAYFADIVESFDVVDEWEDKSNDGSGILLGKIKEEQPSSSKRSSSSRQRTESERSGNNNRDPRTKRSHDTVSTARRSRSPDRNRRSPPRRPPHSSRRRSPPRRENRRNSPTQSRRNNQTNRPSFFEEITQQIPELGQDLMRNQQTNAACMNNPNFGFGMQPVVPLMMPNQGFVAGPSYNMHQQIQNGPMFPPVFDQQHQFQMNQFYNGMSNQPTMMPMPSAQNNEPPLPVPPPQLSSGFKNPKHDPRAKQQQKSPLKEAYNIEQAKKKAFNEGKIGLSDFLRQQMHQSAKEQTAAETNMKRQKVQERCKNAAKLLDEIGANKTKLPFVLFPSKKSLPKIRADPSLKWKSPLIMNDNNVQFVSQAKFHSCRDAFKANPLRNIAGKLFQFSRNLGLDLVDISQKVQKQVEIKREGEQRRAAVADISTVFTNPSLKISHQCTQTDSIGCRKCEKRESLKTRTISTQVKMPGKSTSTQYEPELNSFSVSLNARTIDKMSREQHNALVVFCSVFNIDDQRFQQPVFVGGQFGQDERDDQRIFMNSENPVNDNMFISFSPVRPSSERSPKRKHITERLGTKIQSPLRQQSYDDDGRDSLRSSGYLPLQTYRIPTPPLSNTRFGRAERSSFSPGVRGRRNRSRSRSKSPPIQKRKRSRSPLALHARRGRY